MVYENNLDKVAPTNVSLPDVHQKLIAETYPTINTKTTITYPGCHQNAHAGDVTPTIILNPNSAKSDAAANSSSSSKAQLDATLNSHSSSNSSAKIGDTTSKSNSSATGGDANALGGAATSSAKSGDSNARANGGSGGNVNFVNNERTAPDVIPATVVPGAPAATGFEIIDGPRVYKENSNASKDTTNFGVSVGVPSVGVGISFGESRSSDMKAVNATQRKEDAAFYGVFFPNAVQAADSNLGEAASRLRANTLNEVQREELQRAQESAREAAKKK